MKRLLPTLTLIGCTKVNSDLPSSTAERCAPEIQAVIDACNNAQVVGENENPELNQAVDDARECIGGNVRMICSETDMTKITSFYLYD